jgi:Lrp/AsnC family leucine-responsive transcriptional regulator
MTNLDALDVRILNILQENARITTLELAEQVGLSPTPCARRVKRLEDDGLIDRYVTLLDPKKAGLDLSVFISVRLRNQTAETIEKFDRSVRAMPEISECYLIAGVHDYLLHLRVADVEALRDFLRNRLTAIEGIAEAQSSIVIYHGADLVRNLGGQFSCWAISLDLSGMIARSSSIATMLSGLALSGHEAERRRKAQLPSIGRSQT